MMPRLSRITTPSAEKNARLKLIIISNIHKERGMLLRIIELIEDSSMSKSKKAILIGMYNNY